MSCRLWLPSPEVRKVLLDFRCAKWVKAWKPKDRSTFCACAHFRHASLCLYRGERVVAKGSRKSKSASAFGEFCSLVQTNIYIVVRKNLSVQCVMAKNDKKSSFQSTPEILLSLSKYQIFLPLNRCPPFWFYYGKAVLDNLYEELYKMRWLL